MKPVTMSAKQLCALSTSRINLSLLASQGLKYPLQGGVEKIMYSVQILLESCFVFGVNPLPRLRKTESGLSWTYYPSDDIFTEKGVHRFFQEVGIPSYLWACGEGMVCSDRTNSFAGGQMVVGLPPLIESDSLSGSPLEIARDRNRRRAKSLFVATHKTGYNIQLVDFL